MNTNLVSVTAISLALLLDNAPARKETPLAHPPGVSQASDVRHLKRTSQSGISYPLRAVIWDSAAFRELWRRATSSQYDTASVPPVDFDRFMIVVAAMGLRPMLDGDIRIESVDRTGAVVRVRVTMNVLQDGCTLGAVAGYPLDIVQVPRSKAYDVIAFVEEYRPERCKR